MKNGAAIDAKLQEIEGVRRRLLAAILAAASIGAALSYAGLSHYFNAHNTRFVTEPCRRNAMGEEVCPPSFKP